MPTIAVLALQGAFIEHENRLASLGAAVFEIRQLRDASRHFDALVLPGGESTVQGKLLHDTGLFEPLRDKIAGGMPVFGTCAGMILLAKEIENDKLVHFGMMDITVRRNAYGRQLGSFHGEAAFAGGKIVPLSFIRAPQIVAAGADVEILAKCDGIAVAARQGNMLTTAFHPELDNDNTIHQYFLDMIKK